MSLPLATMRRQSQLVWLHDAMDAPRPVGPTGAASFGHLTAMDPRFGKRLAFAGVEQARHWLAFWRGDSAAMMSLRTALQRGERAAPVYTWNDEQLLLQLAARLARGAMVAVESAQRPAPAVMPSAPAPALPADPPAVPVARLLGPLPTPPPILPVLEEVQIEGAEVLPEIEQSLEQVDVSLAQIKVAPVSLEPAPSKVPGIQTAMTDASASVQSELDKL